MDFLISIEDPQQALSFLQSVRSRPGVDRVRILTDTPVALLPAESADEPSFSERFYGSLQSGLTGEEIDHQLQTLRNEWDRPTW